GRWQRKIDKDCITSALHSGNNTNTIDMALHDMSAKPVTRPQGALEIQSCSFFPIANRGALERGGDSSDIKPTSAEFANRQTRAVHGDAFAGLEVTERSANSKLAPRAGLPHAVNLTYLFDQSRKHQASRNAYTDITSSPNSARRTIGTREGVSRKSAASPSNGLSAPVPRVIGD